MYDPKSLKAEEFINDGEIRATLEYADSFTLLKAIEGRTEV